MNRREALDAIKKLNKAQLMEAFLRLHKEYEDIAVQMKENSGMQRFWRSEADYLRGKLAAYEPKKVVVPVPPLPSIDYHKLIEASLHPRPSVVEVVRPITTDSSKFGPVVEVVKPKMSLCERVQAWIDRQVGKLLW